MNPQYVIRRDHRDIAPYLDAIRDQADSERDALGFLPEPAYAEASRQRKLILLLRQRANQSEYAGHLLFGGMFPTLRVRQISVAREYRRDGNATNLLRTLISQAEKEGYLHIVANVAADLIGSNLFYERNGFATTRLKPGGATRNRMINVRLLQLETPSLISLMTRPNKPKTVEIIQPKKRSLEAPIYAIDLNVFFDAIRSRARSEDAGVVFEAAFRHHIRLAASQEFITELKRNSAGKENDPVLALAKGIPVLPIQDKSTIEKLKPLVSQIVFPERSKSEQLHRNDKSDVLHLVHAIAAGASGYVTSDSKILSARDSLMTDYNLDVIGLSEFVELLELPPANSPAVVRGTKHFRIENPTSDEISSFLMSEDVDTAHMHLGVDPTEQHCSSIRDSESIIGISLLAHTRGIDQPSRAIVCVRQDHPFSSTIADYLISELNRRCSTMSACHVILLDIPSHPITRRIALSHGFQIRQDDHTTLAKIAYGRPITSSSWRQARLAIERLSGVKLQENCPHFNSPAVKLATPQGSDTKLSLFELETLLSPTVLAFSKRNAVIVPITRSFAADLLGTDRQYSLLDVPEAMFLSRRTYFNTTRAARAMIRGAAIAFYESGKHGGQQAIVALGRIVDVTSIPVSNVPEALQRGAVVDDLSKLTSAGRVLATTFDNLIALKNPVPLKKLREIGCVTGANFVSATPVSASHLKAIVDAGCKDD